MNSYFEDDAPGSPLARSQSCKVSRFQAGENSGLCRTRSMNARRSSTKKRKENTKKTEENDSIENFIRCVYTLLSKLQCNHMDDSQISKLVTDFGKEGDTPWYSSLDADVLRDVVNKVAEIAPQSKGYDEVSALQLVVNCYDLNEKGQKDLLDATGCIVEQSGMKQKFSVCNEDKFWNFFNDVIECDVHDRRSCRLIKRNRVFKILANSTKKEMKSTLEIITDPGADPNSDDEKAAAFIEKMRYLLGLWSKTNYIVSAVGSLGERKQRLEHILRSIGVPGWRICVYDTEEERGDDVSKNGGYLRFFAPAAFSWNAACSVDTYEVIRSNVSLGDVDSILIIGQLGPRFMEKLACDCHREGKVRYMGIQGPGFNTLGSKVETICDCGVTFGFSNTEGAAKVSREQLEKSMAILDKIHEKASSYRDIQVWTFMNTENGSGAFQRMFLGFSYKQHFPKLLQKIKNRYIQRQFE